MTTDDEWLALCLCMKAAAIMEDAASIIRPPFDCTEDILSALEALEQRADAIAKMVVSS